MGSSVKYVDHAYANSRLSGSLVTDAKKSTIYKVLGVSSLEEFNVSRLKKPNDDGPTWNEAPLHKQDDLSFEPFPLGNVIINFDTYYLFRIANRRNYKQGLRPDSTGYYRKDNGALSQLPEEDNPSFLYMPLLGMYPSVSEAVEMAESGAYTRVPISRSFSIDRYKALFYRYRPLSVGRLATQTVILHDDKFHKELLPMVRKEIIGRTDNKYRKAR